jgi:hypothetical protein
MRRTLFALLCAFCLVPGLFAQEIKFGLGAGSGGSSSSGIESKGGVLLTPSGAADIMIWRAPAACTVTKVQGHMAGGTSGAVNARKNGASALLASDLAITAGNWSSTATIQNASFAIGDYLEVRLISLVGSPSTVTIQVECTR